VRTKQRFKQIQAVGFVDVFLSSPTHFDFAPTFPSREYVGGEVKVDGKFDFADFAALRRSELERGAKSTE
jgi:hypothetical protein